MYRCKSIKLLSVSGRTDSGNVVVLRHGRQLVVEDIDTITEAGLGQLLGLFSLLLDLSLLVALLRWCQKLLGGQLCGLLVALPGSLDFLSLLRCCGASFLTCRAGTGRNGALHSTTASTRPFQLQLPTNDVRLTRACGARHGLETKIGVGASNVSFK